MSSTTHVVTPPETDAEILAQADIKVAAFEPAYVSGYKAGYGAGYAAGYSEGREDGEEFAAD